MSNEAVVAITAVVGAVTAALALALSIYNTIDEKRSRRPATIEDQRRERETRMRDACEILEADESPNKWTPLEERAVRLATKCYVGVPTQSIDHEYRPFPSLAGPGMTPEQSYVLFWPIWLPHGTPIEEDDYLVVRSPGTERRFRVVWVYGPYTDELSRDIVARLID